MIDAEVLSFNDECNNEPEPLLNVTVDQTDEEASQDRPQVVPRKLSKAMETRKWFRLLSTITHLQLHPIVAQLESQLTDRYLESNA